MSLGHIDFEMLELILAAFDEIIVLPHILTETSNLITKIAEPARRSIQERFGRFVEMTIEIRPPSLVGVHRQEHHALGLTDAMILHVCNLVIDGLRPTLVTIDSQLADAAAASGYDVIDYRQEYLGSA